MEETGLVTPTPEHQPSWELFQYKDAVLPV